MRTTAEEQAKARTREYLRAPLLRPWPWLLAELGRVHAMDHLNQARRVLAAG